MYTYLCTHSTTEWILSRFMALCKCCYYDIIIINWQLWLRNVPITYMASLVNILKRML